MLPALLLFGCEGDKQKTVVQKTVVAWPGMAVADFNRLNKGNVEPLRLDDSDLAGVNSPVFIVFRPGTESISFLDTNGSGGLKLTSGDYDFPRGEETGVQRITTMSFNIGGTMENLAERLPSVTAKCNQLAALAGQPPTVLPDARTLSRRLAADDDEVEVCSGRGDRFVFEVSAFHYRPHHAHGGDFERASFLVFLGAPR
jgi:hypothetical protein